MVKNEFKESESQRAQPTTMEWSKVLKINKQKKKLQNFNSPEFQTIGQAKINKYIK